MILGIRNEIRDDAMSATDVDVGDRICSCFIVSPMAYLRYRCVLHIQPVWLLSPIFQNGRCMESQTDRYLAPAIPPASRCDYSLPRRISDGTETGPLNQAPRLNMLSLDHVVPIPRVSDRKKNLISALRSPAFSSVR